MGTSEVVVTPEEVRGYLKATGWIPLNRSPLAELWRLYDSEEEVVLVPVIPGASDFEKRISILVRDLSRVESRAERDLRSDIASVFFDVTDIRASHPTLIDGSIPLEAGYELFVTARQLRVASAAATIRRQGHFSKSMPLRAREHAREVRLGQTKHGSYVVPIISQARAPDDVYLPNQERIDIEVEETLFDRRVTATMSRALGALEELAKRDRLPSRSEIADSVGEGVSVELCRALSKLVRTESVADLDITFSWSRVAPAPRGSVAKVDFNEAAIDVVDQVSHHLRKAPGQREHVIYGVITNLSRRPEEPSGRVGIETLLERRRRVVWIDLGDELYHLAVRCHDAGIPVTARGVLRSPPGGMAQMDVAYFGADSSLITEIPG